MIFFVFSVKGACKLKKSDFFKSSSKETRVGIFSFGVLVLQITFIPNAFAISATFEPIFPYPKIPRVFPANSSNGSFQYVKSGQFIQSLFWTDSLWTLTWFVKCKIKEKTCWATAFVLYDGIFVTIIFLRRAASISTTLYPVAKTPIYFRLGHCERISSVIDADKIIVVDDGKISDIGTHDELMKSCEEYQEIYYSQMDKEEVSA